MGRVSPHLHRPEHFRIYAERLETAIGGGHRLVFAAPPQHGKTEVTLHAIAKLIERFPGKRSAYLTYSLERARSVGIHLGGILASCGLVQTGTQSHFRFAGGAQLMLTSILGGITGQPVDGFVIIDDPIKGFAEAQSRVVRERTEMSFRQNVMTRLHPGASCIVLATRWHPQDLSGILIGEKWEYINLPAIAEEIRGPKGESVPDANGRAPGEPLFPAMWPLDTMLERKREVGDFTFESLYQGRPRPRGGKVFHDPTFYSRLPTESYRGAFGVDLAYTAKSSSDYSVCLELWREDRFERGVPVEPMFYVVGIDRAKVEAPSFTLTLKARHARRRAWPMLWRASGPEQGSAQFIQEKGIPLTVEQPPGDKFVSSMAVAAAWNAGRVQVPDPEFFPEAEAWLYAFLDVVRDFTGGGKELDDDVDALANAHALLEGDNDMTPATGPSSRR